MQKGLQLSFYLGAFCSPFSRSMTGIEAGSKPVVAASTFPETYRCVCVCVLTTFSKGRDFRDTQLFVVLKVRSNGR